MPIDATRETYAIAYKMWWHDFDWCVVAREKVGEVVSVQFNPPSPRSYRERRLSPRPAKSRELEDA